MPPRPPVAGPRTSANQIITELGSIGVNSGVVNWHGLEWLATATQAIRPGCGGGIGCNWGEPVRFDVYRWSGFKWKRTGTINLSTSEAGELGFPKGHEGLQAAFLTRSRDPDFVLTSLGGSSIGPESSVLSAVGGEWHAVPVDFGTGPTIGVDAGFSIKGALIEAKASVSTGDQLPPEDTYTWYRYSDGMFVPTDPPGLTSPCTHQGLGGIEEPDGSSQPYSYIGCADGWELATGTRAGGPWVVLLNWSPSDSSWTRLEEDDGSQLGNASSTYILPLSLLEHLNGLVDGSVAPEVAAAQINTTLSSPFGDSGVIRYDGVDWLVTVVSVDDASGSRASGPTLSVKIYRWTSGSWVLDGNTQTRGGFLGDPPGNGIVVPVWITGSADPDFIINSSGADTRWFAVISDMGGPWHAVPFNDGNEDTGIDAAGVQGSLVEAEVDACGCASGPESYIWYRYMDGMFQPTNPPGPLAPCSTDLLDSVANVTSTGSGVSFSDVACADGWAFARGTENGGKVVGLFQQQGTTWIDMTLDDGSKLASNEGDLYAIPPWLFQELASRIGIAFTAPASPSAS
jgi:hypothetical protein